MHGIAHVLSAQRLIECYDVCVCVLAVLCNSNVKSFAVEYRKKEEVMNVFTAVEASGWSILNERYLFDWIGCVTWNASTNCCYLFFYLVLLTKLLRCNKKPNTSIHSGRPIAHYQPIQQINGRCLINIYTRLHDSVWEMLIETCNILTGEKREEKNTVVQLSAQFAVCSFQLFPNENFMHQTMKPILTWRKRGKRMKNKKKTQTRVWSCQFDACWCSNESANLLTHPEMHGSQTSKS